MPAAKAASNAVAGTRAEVRDALVEAAAGADADCAADDFVVGSFPATCFRTHKSQAFRTRARLQSSQACTVELTEAEDSTAGLAWLVEAAPLPNFASTGNKFQPIEKPGKCVPNDTVRVTRAFFP